MSHLNISILPDELLPNIFSFLPTNDKLNASLVCRKWLHYMDHPKLLSDICVRIPEDQLENAVPFSRRFTNFAFFQVEISLIHVMFLKMFGENIKKLAFRFCYDMMTKEHQQYCHALKLCRNLQVLEFDGLFLKIFSDLPFLKEFTSMSKSPRCSDLSDLDLYQLGKTMPNLEKFVLDQTITCNKIVMKRFYPKNELEAEKLSDLVSTLPAIYDFVNQRAKTLIHLSLPADCLLQESSSIELFKINNLKLSKLFIGGCFEILRIIPEICILQPTITDLQLTQLTISDDVICHICKSLPLLKSLVLKNIPRLNSSVRDIFQLRHLRCLDISENSYLRDESLQNAIDVFQLHYLKSLNLNATCPEDVTVQKLIVLLPFLHHLNLGFCKKLSDRTVQIISSDLIYLRHLSLAGCDNITDKGIFPSESDRRAISNLKNLEELNLSRCKSITAEAIELAVKFVGLRILYTNLYSPELEDILRAQNPSLKSLYQLG